MTIPTFIDLQEQEQCEELRQYLKDLGGSIAVENAPQGFVADLHEIINVSSVSFKEENESDIESVLNSIVSLIIQVPHTDTNINKLVGLFCEKLVQTTEPKMGLISLRVLQNLFEGLGENKLLRYDVYFSLITIAGKTNQIHLITIDLDTVKTWFSGANGVSTEKFQNLYRLLHEVLLQTRNGGKASKVMIELLGTYTEENASQARSDAQKCIVSSLVDPNTFLMDNLLTLKPVKILEGEKIHDLLTIFVSEKLGAYVAFYEANKAFVDSLGLNHEQNMKKMRLLTFMQLAESRKEIAFEQVQSELLLGDADVEPFIIDVLKTKLVRAKIDQLTKKIVVSSTMHRTFGKPQWQQLHDTLKIWQFNLGKVQSTIAQAIHTHQQVPA